MRDPAVGERLDQFELQELLARSGMASIFKATDTVTGATVALKIPYAQLEADVVFFERFNREEQIGQELEHPNIVRILKLPDKGRMYMAMEFVEGRSLRAIMGKEPLPREKAIDVGLQVGGALAYLESKKIVHRDIKPENILLTPEGRVKILDFGIALNDASRRLTWAGLSATLGTPDYMAPEQIRGRRGDARTDVYALGILLYEMLTASLPFESGNPRALLRAKASEEPRPPTYYLPGFDPHLEAIIMKAIERDPRERYESAAHLCTDLRNPAVVPVRDPETGLRRTAARSRQRRRLILLAIAAALGFGLGGLVWLSGRSPAPPAPSSASPRGR
jgi:eukaryotic-like serine/threonine-protein kinase